LICDEDGNGRVNRIYTDCLSGPLFAEFSDIVVQDLHVHVPAQEEDEPSTVAPENTLEDYLADESALSRSSDLVQRPSCDHHTVVELRLIGGEKNIQFEDQNLLETPSTADHQDETSASGTMVNKNYYCYYYNYYYNYYY